MLYLIKFFIYNILIFGGLSFSDFRFYKTIFKNNNIKKVKSRSKIESFPTCSFQNIYGQFNQRWKLVFFVCIKLVTENHDVMPPDFLCKNMCTQNDDNTFHSVLIIKTPTI
jgi:hypothetical protein